MGHTTANSAQALRAKQVGVKSVTHLFNAMNGLHHREPGLAGFSLLDRDLYTEVIADGVHVSDDTVRLVLRMRPLGRIILISDGCLLSGRKKKGAYTFGGIKVKVQPDGSLRLSDGTLAGGNSTLSDIVSRVTRISGLPRSKVLAMATANPLRMLGLHGSAR